MAMPHPAPIVPDGQVEDHEARDMALFLVRIFGDEAASVAAERATKSTQRMDWQRVGRAIDKLLCDERTRADRSPLRLFD
jgi:hypothetical protein